MTQEFSSDISPVGQRRIHEASQAMSIAEAAVERFLPVGSLSGMRIGSAMFLDPKSAAFLVMLRAAGADVTVLPTVGNGDREVAQALKETGLQVLLQEPDADSVATVGTAEDLLECKPDIVLDESGAISGRLNADYSPRFIIDQTVHGRRVLEKAIESRAFGGTAVALDTSPLARLVDAGGGAGQSAVLAFVDVTNLQLGGRSVLVCGFGAIGESVAHFARGFGAKVTVAETDPLANLRALNKGYTLATTEDAAKSSEIVFVASDATQLTAEQLVALPDGASICVVTDTPDQLPLDSLETEWSGQDVRQHVRQYTSPKGGFLNVIAGGGPIAKIAGEGSPIEAMDIVFALHAAALSMLINDSADLQPGLVSLPHELEVAIAEMKLGGA